MSEIRIKDLVKEFRALGQEPVVAVDGIDLTIREGEFFTLVGPSGCGKTSTLRCIAGLEQPTSGTIEFGGRDVTNVPPNKRELAMMFQNIALYPHMTIIDNIAYPLKVRHVPKEERYEEARQAAEIMKIDELLEKHPGELSGGQRQRAAIARTIVQDPVAFLMDEPLSDLDAKLKVEIRKEIQRIHKRFQKPVVYVTHDQEEAMTMSDRIGVMNDGKIIQVGSPDELYNHPKTQFVASFIGMPSMNFTRGQIESMEDGSISVKAQDRTFELAIEYVENDPIDSEVNLGFRPEVTNLGEASDDADMTGEIKLLERIGDRILATIDGPDGELQATVAHTENLAEGQTTGISINRDGLYLFDAANGDLVAKSTAA